MPAAKWFWTNATAAIVATACAPASQPSPQPTATSTAGTARTAKLIVPAQLDEVASAYANRTSVHFAQQVSGEDSNKIVVRRCMERIPGCSAREARVTPAGQAKLQAVEATLDAKDFEPAYGCPGCADGPVLTLVLHHADGHVTQHTLDPTHSDEWPAELGEAVKLASTLVAALDQCQTTDLVMPNANCKQIMERTKSMSSGIP